MKIILINPPLSMSEQTGKTSMTIVANILPPLGIGYIAAFLEKNEFPVKIIDCQVLGIGHKELKNRIEKEQPDIIGITCTTLSFPSAAKVAENAKKVSENSCVVIGGPHITTLPLQTMKLDCFDVGIYGEGEVTFLDFVKNIKNIKKVPGLYYKKGKKIIFTGVRPFIKDLDSLPFPAMHLFPPLSKYHPTPASYRTLPLGIIMTSRGCPYQCTFCDKKVFGNVTRFRSPDNVLEEMEELIEKHGAKEIKFFDDTFTLNQERVLEICKGIRKRKLDVKWSCLTRVNTVSKKLLLEMKRAGCWHVIYGLESGDQRMLDRMKKGITLSQSRNAIRWSKEVGLNVRGAFVIGTPGETVESVKKTIDFAKSLDVDSVNFYAFVPLPGTEIYDYIIKEGKLRHKQYEYYNVMITADETEVAYIPDDLTEELMKKLIRHGHKSFYFRPWYMFKQILRMRKIDDIKRYINGFRAIKSL